jgi:hypothetical protein
MHRMRRMKRDEKVWLKFRLCSSYWSAIKNTPWKIIQKSFGLKLKFLHPPSCIRRTTQKLIEDKFEFSNLSETNRIDAVFSVICLSEKKWMSSSYNILCLFDLWELQKLDTALYTSICKQNFYNVCSMIHTSSPSCLENFIWWSY